ncbi:TetR/AcrR family transcriptional regulator [Streptomyces sp. NBC_00414]|uniref:TetR/AcrR family transcriptional regulator n=1 Tax=Streptomyces sp. NBC_00414 TaxID=2975739 RepID=UPI002E21D614
MPPDHRRVDPRRKPRQVRAELTRGRILAAAAHVFAEYGYAAGTTNRIAEEARVSIGSLYQYFPNKDAILAELLVQHIGGGTTGGTADGGGEDILAMSLQDALRTLVRATIDNHRGDPHLLRIMLEQAPRSSGLAEKLARYEKERVAQIRELLEKHPDAHVRDVDTAAVLIVSTIEFVTHNLMSEPRPVEARRLEDELVTMLSRYLAP